MSPNGGVIKKEPDGKKNSKTKLRNLLMTITLSFLRYGQHFIERTGIDSFINLWLLDNPIYAFRFTKTYDVTP
jgi:hypothetical protein